MAGATKLLVPGREQAPLAVNDRRWGLSGDQRELQRGPASASFKTPFVGNGFTNARLVSRQSWKRSLNGPKSGHAVCMTLVDDRVARVQDVRSRAAEVLAYDLIQGANVRWSSVVGKAAPDPPTAVLLHGILGSRKNWGSFARRLANQFPTWQFLLVDLRCHGDSASIEKIAPHTVASTALDVLKLVGKLKITPRVLVGHSFGGKVALSMVDQAAKPLARPVKVWVLDATPGKVRPGGDGEDHPAELISFLSKMPNKVSSKQAVINALVEDGFSKDVAQWVGTSLRPVRTSPLSSSGFAWIFDLEGIAEMYESYEKTNLWKVVEDVPRGVHVNFLKAERSLHRWALEDIQRIHAAEEMAAEEGAGIEMHVLEDAGHWVYSFRIANSFILLV
ncbi:unnamed protein product [Victoria cruziana]